MRDPITFSQANLLQKLLRRVAATGPGAWFFARVLHRIDRPMYRATGGRHTFASLLSGLPVVMLTTTGARTGQTRTVPLLGIPTERGVAVIASNFGQAHHPGWYHNLRARPEAEIVVDGERRLVRAVVLDGEARERVWREGLRIYPGFAEYERRATHRRITVFAFEPR